MTPPSRVVTHEEFTARRERRRRMAAELMGHPVGETDETPRPAADEDDATARAAEDEA